MSNHNRAVDPRLQTRASRMFGVDYPIVQTGTDRVAKASHVVAAAEAGGLGILASATMCLEEMKGSITQIRSSTDCNFGVSLRPDSLDIESRIEYLISSRVRVVNLTQDPSPQVVEQLRDGGVIVMSAVSTSHQAEEVAERGADIILCIGAEGGGVAGAVSTLHLLPQILDVVDMPVIVAGGFYDGRGLAAALAFGADGIAMGAKVLLTSGCHALDEPIRFRKFGGRSLISRLRYRRAMKRTNNLPSSQALPPGQCVGVLGDPSSCNEQISQIVVDAVGRLDDLSA